MKRIYINLIWHILLVINNSINPTNSYSQFSNWQPLRNITSGYNDRNPQFGKFDFVGVSLYSWEFMVFERVLNTSSHQICVLKIGLSGPLDSIIYITNNSFINRNPFISYDRNFSGNILINKSLILWETNQNGRWDIYGSYYDINTGWSSPFSIDTTSLYNKSSPRSIFINGTNFAVVYERNNDIIYKHINAKTHSVTYDTNLTINDTSICSNPFISGTSVSSEKHFVSYEIKKQNNENGISFRVSNGLPNWNPADTLAFMGNNINYGFVLSSYGNSRANIFGSNREGNYNIYETSISFNNALRQDSVIRNSNSNNKNFSSFYYPIITDKMNGNPFEVSRIGYQAASYLKIGPDSTRVKFRNFEYMYYSGDSTTIGDTSTKTSLTMNRGLRSGNNARLWVIFNKDSSSYSNLYARYSDVVISEIYKISSVTPGSFSLYQNYPNPFNPLTKIRFDVPKVSSIKLMIYNSLGQVIEHIVNQKFEIGSYEVTWSGEKFASGVYFYRIAIQPNELETEEVLITKKLLLIK